MKIYRAAILGCRGRGTAAARAYHAHHRTELVALCDLVAEPLNALGDELGVAARFTDLDEMIEKTQPDIVAIPTGTEFHYDLSMRVLEHGVHIEVEKPICVDLEQADAVMAKARDKGVRVAVHHQGRCGVYMQTLGKAFTEGRIGELRYISGRGKGYYAGYDLMNIGTHMLNNVLKIAGPCRSVSAVAMAGGHCITPEDVVPSPSGMGTIAGEFITATLQFDNNATASLLHDRVPGRTNPMLEFHGTEGRLFLARLLYREEIGVLWLPQPHYVPGIDDGLWQTLDTITPEHFDPQGIAAIDDYCFVEEYVNALDERRDHECSGDEAHHVLEIIMGMFESAAYGRRVDLPQQDRHHPLLRWRKEHGLSKPLPVPRPYQEWLETEDHRMARTINV